MKPVVIKTSSWDALLVVAGSGSFSAAGIFLMLHKEHSLVGWACVIFFGGCTLVGCRMLFDTRPRLIINRHGIWDRTLGVGHIRWEDVLGAYVQTISGYHFICLTLRNPERYRGRLSSVRRAMASANEALGCTEYSINLCGVAARAEEVIELVLKLCAASKLDA